MTDFEVGTCNYTIIWVVIEHTSGNELSGPAKKWGVDYPSELDAKIALTNSKEAFYRKDNDSHYWYANGGHTQAYITRKVVYDFN